MAYPKESTQLTVPFEDIELATKNFTTKIGEGGFGTVYKGEFSVSGKLTSVAVKRLQIKNLSGQGQKEFLTEIHLLSRCKHPNLVSLLGYCEENNEKILIYEYAKNGSLEKYLSQTTCPFTWKQRLNICIDAARGLKYLHNLAKNDRIIHRDIKSANILLDHNWKGMIADLGLSKIGRANEKVTFLITNACGTFGYCDPAYMRTGVLTKESDVYSFGVVLFEVLCGRLCYRDINNETRFLSYVAPLYYEKNRLNEIIDPDLKLHMDSDSVKKFSDIAYQCLLNDREKRPSISLVLQKLEIALELLELEEALGLPKIFAPSTSSEDIGIGAKTANTVVAWGLKGYNVVSSMFGGSSDHHSQEDVQPLPPPVQLGEISEEELKAYDGSDPNKPLLMAIKGQIYDVSQSMMFYGPGGPYALFAAKDASRALAKMSFEEQDLNGDLTGLGAFELDALQDWEDKFISRYVKVGSIKNHEIASSH